MTYISKVRHFKRTHFHNSNLILVSLKIQIGYQTYNFTCTEVVFKSYKSFTQPSEDLHTYQIPYRFVCRNLHHMKQTVQNLRI